METHCEVASHGPVFLEAGGSQPQLEALSDIDGARDRSLLFSATERAVIALAIEMTRFIRVSDYFLDGQALLRICVTSPHPFTHCCILPANWDLL
ncbi:hypothetical protein FHX03_006395 [Rhizobium sp. BK456]|nr:hypothetical protein [Rhizobium sp. BK456]